MKGCKAGMALTYLAWHHQLGGQQGGEGAAPWPILKGGGLLRIKSTWSKAGPGSAAEPGGHDRCPKGCGSSPEWLGFPRPRAVLFGAAFGAAWASAEHLHPLATPAYTHLPLCLGLGLISCYLGVPSIVLAPSPCWSLPVGRCWTYISRDNLPGLHDPSHLPPWLGPH